MPLFSFSAISGLKSIQYILLVPYNRCSREELKGENREQRRERETKEYYMCPKVDIGIVE
jgi:hypothetical protein